MLNCKKIVLLIFTFAAAINVFGQSTESENPIERLDLTVSQQVLFSGETLWFSINSSNSGLQSELSSLCFVELINCDHASLIRKKVKLLKGRGESYFQLPDSLSTGVYTILAYTNWMKNFNKEGLSITEISILNPEKPFVSKFENKYETTNYPNFNRTQNEIKSSVYEKRKRIELGELIDKNKFDEGTYTVVVKRKEPVLFSKKKEKHTNVSTLKGMEYLPDYKGIIVSGKLYGADNREAAGQEVLLSLPGNGADLLSSITDAKGKFAFLLECNAGDKDLVFTLPGSEMKLKLDDPFLNGVQVENGYALQLDSTALNYLQEKYFYQQLSKRFGNWSIEKVQADSQKVKDFTFYSTPNRTFNIDEYILLDSIAEYFYELIPSVHFNRVNKSYALSVIKQKGKVRLGDHPGVFIDGVFYTDFDNMAKIPTEKIDRIEVLWEKYYYKDFTFDGIVSVHTKKADFYSVDLQQNMTRIIYPMADKNNIRFRVKEHVSEQGKDRQPDLRYLLLWKPSVDWEGLQKLNFFTSDVTGQFEILVTGYSSSGSRIFYSNDFYVE